MTDLFCTFNAWFISIYTFISSFEDDDDDNGGDGKKYIYNFEFSKVIN